MASGSPRTAGTLDLLVLTFNCAKNLVQVPIFSSHLEAALARDRDQSRVLPDLIVFSLQEVAPLSYSFVGSYFLSPYYARFQEALNLAATRIEASSDSGIGEDAGLPSGGSCTTSPYQLVRAENVGMTAIMFFARRPAAVRDVQVAECGFGAADMGNKGAVGLRVTYAGGASGGDGETTTELTFVATHLAAMEWNLGRRNRNWRTIVSGLTFANPLDLIPGLLRDARAARGRAVGEAVGEEDVVPSEAEEEGAVLLAKDNQAQLLLEHASTLRDISVFKPSSHLFVAGDLNYRISTTSPPLPSQAQPQAPVGHTSPLFPSLDEGAPNHWSKFLPRDQLTQERRAGRTLHGLEEAEIHFPPTYKCMLLKKGADVNGAVNAIEVRVAAAATAPGGRASDNTVVPFKWAPHRWPGWCDRILYLPVAPWARGSAAGAATAAAAAAIEPRVYDAMPMMQSSDHRPVFLRVDVPLLSAADLAHLAEVAEAELFREEQEQEQEQEQPARSPSAAAATWAQDPRLRLPVPIDVHAWDRRASARRREVLVGWSAVLWSTREGALVLGTVALLGVGGWWLAQGF